jgi:hypothetical protein
MSMTKSRSADALRAAGYVQLPRWWATKEQVELIEWMVRQNLPDIARIKAEAHGIDEIEAAWRQHKEKKNAEVV